MWSLVVREEEEATSMMEEDPTNNRTTYRTKGLGLKHEDSKLKYLNISYVEQGRGVFILKSHLNVLHIICLP